LYAKIFKESVEFLFIFYDQNFLRSKLSTIQYYTILVQTHPINTTKQQNNKNKKREENEKEIKIK